MSSSLNCKIKTESSNCPNLLSSGQKNVLTVVLLHPVHVAHALGLALENNDHLRPKLSVCIKNGCYFLWLFVTLFFFPENHYVGESSSSDLICKCEKLILVQGKIVFLHLLCLLILS